MRTVALAVRPAYLVRVPPLASEQVKKKVHHRADAAQAFRLPGAAAEFEINERLPQRVETPLRDHGQEGAVVLDMPVARVMRCIDRLGNGPQHAPAPGKPLNWTLPMSLPPGL